MLALCNHTLPIVACTVDRKRLRVFCVHDTKSFNIFKEAYDNILNDDKGRKPVLLVAGTQMLKTLLKSGLDLNPFVVCLFASCKKVGSYDGINVLDMDENNNPVTLKISEINKALHQAKPGIPGLPPPPEETRAKEPEPAVSNEPTNLALKFRQELVVIVKRNRELNMSDFNQLVRAYNSLLKEVSMAGSGKSVFEEADKYSKDTPLQDMITYAVNNFILDSNAELAINKIIITYIFQSKNTGLAALAKELHQWLPSKYSVRLAKEVARRKPAIRKAFYLTKNGMTIRKALERTQVRPEDLLLAYTFFPKSYGRSA